MSTTKAYQTDAISFEQVSNSQGFMLLEFGTDWCGHCNAAQAPITEALSTQPTLLHIKEEDGAGRRLGRHFKVKLWPTLVLLKDGVELDRVVRPTTEKQVTDLLAKLG